MRLVYISMAPTKRRPATTTATNTIVEMASANMTFAFHQSFLMAAGTSRKCAELNALVTSHLPDFVVVLSIVTAAMATVEIKLATRVLQRWRPMCRLCCRGRRKNQLREPQGEWPPNECV